MRPPTLNHLRSHLQVAIAVAVLLAIGASCLHAQDLATIREQKPFAWTSSVQTGTAIYHRDGPGAFSAPFSWYLNGNLRLSFYGMHIPANFSIRNQFYNYTVPFTRFGIQPSYKWIKLYAGHNQIFYSPYTLAGMTMLGAGVELTPGKWRVGAMSGVVQNPKTVVDSIAGISGWINPYRRQVSAFKLGFGSSSNYTDMIVLTGHDRNVLGIAPDSLFLPPAANAILGLNSYWSILRNRIRLEWNVAGSAFTRSQDATDIETTDDKVDKLLTVVNKAFTVNNSTRATFAGDASLSFQLGTLTLGGRYQRIDPLYESFGAFYFRDDNENYTINASLPAWQGKVFVSGSMGVQQNNVLNHRSSTTRQIIHQYGLNLLPVSWFGLNAQYSNFNFNQEAGLLTINDTIRFATVNANTTIAPYLSVTSDQFSHSIQLLYSDQAIRDLSDGPFQTGDASVRSANINYLLRSKLKNYTVNVSLNAFQNIIHDQQSDRIGLTVGAQQNWLDNKISARLRLNYNRNFFEGETDGTLAGVNGGFTARILSKYTLTTQINYLDRKARHNRSYREIRANIQLNIPISS